MRDLFKVEDLDLTTALQSKQSIEDEISARATNFARYAMADVEYALGVLGKSLTVEQYEQAFRAMMVRKAKNEVRKYNS